MYTPTSCKDFVACKDLPDLSATMYQYSPVRSLSPYTTTSSKAMPRGSGSVAYLVRSCSSHHETPVSETAVGSVVAQIGVDGVMVETYKAEKLSDGFDVLGDVGVERYTDGCGATIR